MNYKVFVKVNGRELYAEEFNSYEQAFSYQSRMLADFIKDDVEIELVDFAARSTEIYCSHASN